MLLAHFFPLHLLRGLVDLLFNRLLGGPLSQALLLLLEPLELVALLLNVFSGFLVCFVLVKGNQALARHFAREIPRIIESRVQHHLPLVEQLLHEREVAVAQEVHYLVDGHEEQCGLGAVAYASEVSEDPILGSLGPLPAEEFELR